MSERRHRPLREEHADPAACSPQRRLEVLAAVPFLQGLKEEHIRAIGDSFTAVHFERGQTVYFSGDRAEHLYVVATGKVKLVRHTASGKEVVIGLLGPGEFFGGLDILGDPAYPESAYAQTHTCLLTVTSGLFRHILEQHPAVSLQVMDQLARRLRTAQEVIGQLSSADVEERLAAALLRLADRMGEPDSEGVLIQVPLSREELAGLTGTTPETASRVLSGFRRRGWIRSGREWVAITDREALSSLVS